MRRRGTLPSAHKVFRKATIALRSASVSELLGEDPDSVTDQDIGDTRRHAETMAYVAVDMY
jgi:hypothetical protein